MRNSTDPSVKQMMAETQNRVRAMSLVHEKLYRSESLSRIDFAEYTRFLATQLFSFYTINTRRVNLDVTLPRMMVDINTAVPLGLIMNELVSNALKHAFSDGRKGTLAIRGGIDENGRITLVIADDGIGVPPDFDLQNSPTLGMRLVTSLVDQIGGAITLDTRHGTVFTITASISQDGGGTE
jgi:two-component sensor histidine kinase